MCLVGLLSLCERHKSPVARRSEKLFYDLVILRKVVLRSSSLTESRLTI